MPATTLVDLLARFPLVNAVKIDCQGPEADIVSSVSDWRSIRKLVIEYDFEYKCVFLVLRASSCGLLCVSYPHKLRNCLCLMSLHPNTPPRRFRWSRSISDFHSFVSRISLIFDVWHSALPAQTNSTDTWPSGWEWGPPMRIVFARRKVHSIPIRTPSVAPYTLPDVTFLTNLVSVVVRHYRSQSHSINLRRMS